MKPRWLIDGRMAHYFRRFIDWDLAEAWCGARCKPSITDDIKSWHHDCRACGDAYIRRDDDSSTSDQDSPR